MTESLRIVRMTVQKFDQMWSALVELSRKTLPSPESETKVALLVKAYERTHDAVQAVRKKLDDKHIVKAGAKVSMKDPHGYAQKAAALRESTVAVKLPRTLIKKTDLPVVSDGDDDVKNRNSIAAIRAMLGPLFDWEPDAEARELLAEPDQGAFASLEAIAEQPVDETALLDERQPAAPAESGPGAA